jgi:hypothetical protein
MSSDSWSSTGVQFLLRLVALPETTVVAGLVDKTGLMFLDFKVMVVMGIPF